jgi:hypothetical protein
MCEAPLDYIALAFYSGHGIVPYQVELNPLLCRYTGPRFT